MKYISGFQGVIYLLLLASAAIGVYGFTTVGVNAPIVWLLEGDTAPFLWAALVGVIVDCLWRQVRQLKVND